MRGNDERKWLAGIFGVVVLVGLVVGLNYFMPGGGEVAAWGSDGVSPVTVSTTAKPPQYALRILFIDNSYTYVHDIPKQVAEIASSDPGNPIQFTIQSVTRGGVDLKEIYDEGKAAEAIRNGHWDYVVLQQQSFWAMAQASIESTRAVVKGFDAQIKQANAKTLLYLTWVRKPGSHWYSDDQYSFLGSPGYMLKRFVAETSDLAGTIGAQTVNVGIYWQYVLAKAPEINLYESDDHHPSKTGSYLAALVFYKTLTGRDVMKATYKPDGVSLHDADRIKSIIEHPETVKAN